MSGPVSADAPTLPHVLQQVAEVAGHPAALQLAQRCGGTRIYVPKRPTPIFVGQVGSMAVADALCDLYGGENLGIPLGPAGTLAQARRVAERALSEGASAAEAARRSGLTERAIWMRKAKRRERAAADQLGLFDE